MLLIERFWRRIHGAVQKMLLLNFRQSVVLTFWFHVFNMLTVWKISAVGSYVIKSQGSKNENIMFFVIEVLEIADHQFT
jgi:hypothetical protein